MSLGIAARKVGMCTVFTLVCSDFLIKKSNGSFQPLCSNRSLCVRENVETFPGSQGAVMDMICLQAVLLARTDKWKKAWATLVSERCLDLVMRCEEQVKFACEQEITCEDPAKQCSLLSLQLVLCSAEVGSGLLPMCVLV